MRGQPRNSMARLNKDGTLDPAFDPNVAGQVFSLAIQSDGRVLVGGAFNEVGGKSHYQLARLNPDGTVEQEFNPIPMSGTGFVKALAVQPDGKILVGSGFATLGGQHRDGFGRLNA